MDQGFHVIIPARLASTRLPNKVLALIDGQTMLERVYRRALASGAESVHIATADQEVVDVAEGFGASCLITLDTHQSGTERVAEAADALGLEEEDVVVNVQADEPLIHPDCIKQLGAHMCEHPHIKVATLSTPMLEVDALFDPNVVKVVVNKRGNALYFSRAPIPWVRDTFAERSHVVLTDQHQRHIGLYGFRKSFFEQYNLWDTGVLAELEGLEQLRVLWHAGRMCVLKVQVEGPFCSVDTEADLAWVRDYIKQSRTT